MVKCQKCSKYLKNMKGLKIHNYHKHREVVSKIDNNEIAFLKMEIKMIKTQLRALRMNSVSTSQNSDNTNWNIIKSIPKIENNSQRLNMRKVVSELSNRFKLANFGLNSIRVREIPEAPPMVILA